MASRSDKSMVGYFQNPANSKDRFAVADCEDARAKKVLKFLIPILYLDKPSQVTVIVGNMVFGALIRDILVE